MTQEGNLLFESVYAPDNGPFCRCRVRLLSENTRESQESIVVLIPGIFGMNRSFEELLPFLPKKFTIYRLEFSADTAPDGAIAPGVILPDTPAKLLLQATEALHWQNIHLIGHGFGGEIAIRALGDASFSPKVTTLTLLCGAGMMSVPNRFVERLASLDTNNYLLRFANPDLQSYILLEKCFANADEITPEQIQRFADALAIPECRQYIIGVARTLVNSDIAGTQRIARTLTIPTLLIWGADDSLTEVANAFLFQSCIPNAVLHLLPECGHIPQEEQPQACGAAITEFLANPQIVVHTTLSSHSDKEIAPISAENSSTPVRVWRNTKLKMSKLVDYWSFDAAVIFLFIKLLQLAKKLGMRPAENGWRKATGIFLRNEYSKFVLGSFRLRYYGNQTVPTEQKSACDLLISELAKFFRAQPELHWSIKAGTFRTGRRRSYFTDIVEAVVDRNGNVEKLIPHLDDTRNTFSLLSSDLVDRLLTDMVMQHNQMRHTADRKHPEMLRRKLLKLLQRYPDLTHQQRSDLRLLLDRLLASTFVYFEILPPASSPDSQRRRLATPDLTRYKHPGYGLLNIVCRLTPDYSEADLWIQYHHVPVDGMPMQELLQRLKDQWGCRGKILFPALGTPEAKPELTYYGNRLFRARIFVDFEPFLKVRSYLNKHYAKWMDGPATVAGMIIWGLAQDPYFRDNKLLFPVDTSAEFNKSRPRERELSLIFIRPAQYRNLVKPLSGFLDFQREFNQRVERTRQGISESYELLELYSMIHPLFYQFARYVMPTAFHEFVGTMGISVLRDAEIFISPVSDLQVQGFLSVSNLRMPTKDGKTAGAVSICGSKEQIRHYIQAIENMASAYNKFLAIPENDFSEKD